MKTIPLSKGKETIVDDKDYPYLNQWNWVCSSSGYAMRNAQIGDKRKTIYMHRVIMAMGNSSTYVDHINNNRLDNRRENLRCANASENAINVFKLRENKHGYRGVSKVKKRYCAKIRVNGERIHLGYFDTPEEAAKVYDEAALKYHGEFAKTNF